MYESHEFSFAKRLSVLIGCDIAISILDSFIPHELTPVRLVVAFVEFGFMAVTMATTLQRVLEDY